MIDGIRSTATEIAHSALAERMPPSPWRVWAARLVPTVALEAVIARLDSGQPDRDRAPDHIDRAIQAVIQAAQPNERA